MYQNNSIDLLENVSFFLRAILNISFTCQPWKLPHWFWHGIKVISSSGHPRLHLWSPDRLRAWDLKARCPTCDDEVLQENSSTAMCPVSTCGWPSNSYQRRDDPRKAGTQAWWDSHRAGASSYRLPSRDSLQSCCKRRTVLAAAHGGKGKGCYGKAGTFTGDLHTRELTRRGHRWGHLWRFCTDGPSTGLPREMWGLPDSVPASER